MNPLLERFHAEKKSFNRLKKLCESKVVRWKYWVWPDWYWEPDMFVAVSLKPKRAKKGEGEYGYGYDKENRVVVIYEFDSFDSEKVDAMTFLRWSSNKIVGSKFHGAVFYSGDRVA